MIPSYVGAYAFVAALGPRGAFQSWLAPLGVERLPPIYGFVGSWVVLTLFTYPLVLLPVRAALMGLDPSLEEVARSLGRSPTRVFFGVTIPQLRPAAVSGALLVALYTLSDFGAVSLMRFHTFTREIYIHIQTFDVGFADKEFLAVHIAPDPPIGGSSSSDAAGDARRAAFGETLQELRRRVAARPEVAGVTFVGSLPREARAEESWTAGYAPFGGIGAPTLFLSFCAGCDGAILAVADFRSRTRQRATAVWSPGFSRSRPPAGGTPNGYTVRDVLLAMIKAHEIQGILALENSFNRVGLDHVRGIPVEYADQLLDVALSFP